MTWDYCQNFFNYRDYLQVATEALCEKRDRSDDLKRYLLASLHHYYGRLTGDDTSLQQAALLDPGFSLYRLWQAKAIARAGAPDDAVKLLSSVVPEILYAPEAWSLIQALHAEHNTAIPNEAELRDLVERMEGRTLIDEMYAAIRSGPYFRKQRLDLARNDGVAILKRALRAAPPLLSILLADTNGARYAPLLASLPVDPDRFEVILCDVFDRESPLALQHADSVMALGQNEHLYNRNVAFNTALAAATGRVAVFCDGDRPLTEEMLAAIAERAKTCAEENRVLVNAGGEDRGSIDIVALNREAAIQAGGLDESAYYAGAYSGPHELVDRLRGQRWVVETLEALPANQKTEKAQTALQTLFEQIWPTKFSPYRGMPLRENPEIAALRQKLK